ncbi:MAG TPA: thioredoxin family protein [Gammaproteobacteria bacterium]
MELIPYLVVAAMVFIMAMQLRLYFAAKRPQGKAAPHFEDLLDESQRALPRLLFYFHSEYCGPCRRLTPLVQALAHDTAAVIIVDVAQQPELAQRFGVRVTPTLMRVNHGTVEKVVVGEISETKLKQLLG